MLLWWRPVLAYPLPCNGETDQSDIVEALTRIRRSIDPCGESPQVVALLDKVEHCAATSYRICTSLQSDRNSFDRPGGDPALLRTITWNPALPTVMELGCDGDPTKPVLRDATASLLHELTHAGQDCDGLEPSAYEFEAVRVENIYRRAVGICQRSRYGDASLPPEMVRVCERAYCPCTSPADALERRLVDAPSQMESTPRADPVTSGDAQPSSLPP